VLSSREHISIDVLVCRLNKKLRFWLVLTSDVILLIYLLFVEALAIKMITLPGIQMQETPALNIPIIYFYLSLPVGTVIMIIVQTSMILHSLKQIRFCLSETDN